MDMHMANSEDESIFNDKYFEEVQSIGDFKFRVVSYNVSKVQIHLNNSKLSSQESIFGDKNNESYFNPKHRADIYDISLLTKGKDEVELREMILKELDREISEAENIDDLSLNAKNNPFRLRKQNAEFKITEVDWSYRKKWKA